MDDSVMIKYNIRIVAVDRKMLFAGRDLAKISEETGIQAATAKKSLTFPGHILF